MQEKIEIKQLLENPEYFDYITWMQTVRRELENMSDRATIIVMASILDVQLENLLKAYLIDCTESATLFKANGPISTFSSKISMCYCLGIISKHEFETINILRRIRNRFAHEIKVTSFDTDQSSIDLSKNLSIPFGMYVPDLLLVRNNVIQPFPIDVFDKADTRNRILLAFYYVTSYLESRYMYLEKRIEYVAPPQWQLLEDSNKRYNELCKEYIDTLQKYKKILEAQAQSELRDESLTEIERELQRATVSSTPALDSNLTVTPTQYENYCQSLLAAIKESYGVE